MADASKRRWLRFSLRTMFVAFTVVALWLGWNASLVHRRKALLAQLDSGDSYSIADRAELQSRQYQTDVSFSMHDVYAAYAVGHAVDYSFHQPTAPYYVSKVRRWLGD